MRRGTDGPGEWTHFSDEQVAQAIAIETVIGDVVNTASRLEGLCKEKGVHVIVSDGVYQQLSAPERARFRALGATTVKGRQESLVLWGSD